jgi:hypothetical protein
MRPEATEIEVEVLEIDGVAPAELAGPRAAEVPVQGARPDGWHGSGRLRGFSILWWPLWGLLGIVALGLLLSVGLVFGLLALIVWICLKIVRALTG